MKEDLIKIKYREPYLGRGSDGGPEFYCIAHTRKVVIVKRDEVKAKIKELTKPRKISFLPNQVLETKIIDVERL